MVQCRFNPHPRRFAELYPYNHPLLSQAGAVWAAQKPLSDTSKVALSSFPWKRVAHFPVEIYEENVFHITILNFGKSSLLLRKCGWDKSGGEVGSAQIWPEFSTQKGNMPRSQFSMQMETMPTFRWDSGLYSKIYLLSRQRAVLILVIPLRLLQVLIKPRKTAGVHWWQREGACWAWLIIKSTHPPLPKYDTLVTGMGHPGFHIRGNLPVLVDCI